MVKTLPFVRFIKLPEQAEPDALLGFSLPFLPDMLTSRWLAGVNEHERLDEALRLQVRLVNAFWGSNIVAWDLRFIGTDELPGIAIGLICRLRSTPRVSPTQFHDYCLRSAGQVQQLFADFGYELLPLFDEISLDRYLAPFHFKTIAEIRRHEELLVIESAYSEYEVYVTYPLHWAPQNRLRLFEALLHRQGECLVSIYLEPTQLSQHEQGHLNHATSMQVRDLLWRGGPQGESVYNIYQDYVRSLRQPYLLRISLAGTTPQTVQQVGRMFQDELHAPQPLAATERAFLHEFSTAQTSGTGPALVAPQNPQEWQLACRSLYNVERFPWGHNLGMDLPGTARLRYLVDDVAASMAFRLPVVGSGDIPGVPVRSLFPSTGTPPVSGTTGYNPNQASTQPATSSAHSQPNISTQSTPQVVPTAPSDISSIHKPGDLVGKTLGGCLIETLIGQGGFGAVYRAVQLHLKRQVAVKVVLAAISNQDHERQRNMMLRFDREAQAVARLDHPHILTLYEYQPGPLPYMIMPYVAGGSLADELEASGRRPMPANGVAILLNQVASALDYAHGQQLVHRDIKPHNLLRHADARILLTDFGIVQFEEHDLTALTTDKQRSPYTPAYASPEQHQGQKVDHRSDIYSLGVVIYELLCGHRPFNSAYEHVMSPPPPLHAFGVQVHPAIEAVVIKAMAKKPEQRHQSAGELASEFRAALALITGLT
jgi:Protein kinase domain